MSIARTKREKKRQLGQFLTPPPIAQQLIANLSFTRDDKVLEPSMGDGSFVIPIIEKFLSLYSGSIQTRLEKVLANNVYGVELDRELHEKCLANIKSRWGHLPQRHNFQNADFFRCHFLSANESTPSLAKGKATIPFTFIVGNPPFGGTLDPKIQDELDNEFGFRNGEKIKKETYSFFIVKSIDLLPKGGRLLFICSDTFLTIKTMRGLRRLLMNQGEVEITDLEYFSDETSHPMVVLSFVKNGYTNNIEVNGRVLPREKIELTGNFSWRVTDDLAKYFSGPTVGQYMIASSGMTVGKNEYFIREIVGGNVSEPCEFEFFDDPIDLKKEIARARLGKLSQKRVAEIRQQQASGASRRNVRVLRRSTPIEVQIPHPDYCYYNKGANEIVYTPPTHVIYWKDDGDAVITFKKNGNWYLHGVGGQPYFKREGLTWQLIAQSLHTRYLPEGYILDSGAPCAFLRQGVPRDELYFILGWTLTPPCNYLLKEVINHTKNIQSKDFERLPYPFWVSSADKREAISFVKGMVEDGLNGKRFTRSSPEISWLGAQYAFREQHLHEPEKRLVQSPLPLFEPEENLSTSFPHPVVNLRS